jgi:hypothetical protein
VKTLGLPELQARLAVALLREDAREIVGAVASDGLSPAARVAVYWNHVFASLTDALEATYPVVCRLVDRRFFGFAADRFIRSHPPTGPCLFEYGEGFPDFLARFPPCSGHPYLADVARLEWAMNAALHAADARPMEPARLGEVPAANVGRLVFRVDPSAAWLRSPWPVDRIWRANQPDADPRAIVDLATGPVRLEIRRRDEQVTLRALEPADFVLRSALGAGTTFEAAADAAMAEDPGFDLAAALRTLLEEGLLTGWSLQPEAGGPPS